jgi:hypothetical protein
LGQQTHKCKCSHRLVAFFLSQCESYWRYWTVKSIQSTNSPLANCFAGCPIATIPWTRSNTSSDQQTKDAENGSHCHWQVLWMQHMRTFRFATCLNKNLRREHA